MTKIAFGKEDSKGIVEFNHENDRDRPQLIFPVIDGMQQTGA